MIGQHFGQYQLVEKFGQGGMAAVYKAYQPSLDRHVAIKVMNQDLSEDATFVQRFQTEAKAVAGLEHPHILPVYDFGQQNGQLYMVMRLVEGGSLAERIDSTDQPPSIDYQQAARIVGQVASALDYAHRQGVVHRDIKAQNILLGEGDMALLADFGIAKLTQATQALTQTGAVMGTVGYMAPEQANGEAIDGRSDIYSLGVVLFELLAGRLPFQGETPIATMMKHLQDPIPALSAYNDKVPPVMEQIIYRAMAKNPAERFQTGAELQEALQQVQQGATTLPQRLPPQPPPPTVVSATKNTAPNRPWLWLGMGLLGVALVAVIITMFTIGPLRETVPEDSVLALTDYDEVETLVGEVEELLPISEYRYQPFEYGALLFWAYPGEAETLYVIEGDVLELSGPYWDEYPPGWVSEATESNSPPDCPARHPEFGPNGLFGQVWCNDEDLQTLLGEPLSIHTQETGLMPERYTEALVMYVPATDSVWVLADFGEWYQLPREESLEDFLEDYLQDFPQQTN